jgi:hypothetical protein
LQYSNQHDFTLRKVKYIICPGKLQALRPSAKRTDKLVRRRKEWLLNSGMPGKY